MCILSYIRQQQQQHRKRSSRSSSTVKGQHRRAYTGWRVRRKKKKNFALMMQRTCTQNQSNTTTTTSFTSSSPAPEQPRAASCTGPAGSILRANPFSEVTDLDCRFPLPTLIYRPEASYLGDPMRIWVRAGPRLVAADFIGRKSQLLYLSYLPSRFQGPAVELGTPQEMRRSTANRVTNTLSSGE